MNDKEVFSQPDPTERDKGGQSRRTRLRELIERNDFDLEQSTVDMLKLILEQNSHLSHVEVVFISPEEEPDTGGFFHIVQVEEKTFIPTIFIVSANQEHINRLKNTRRTSAARVAEMLGINFAQLSPTLLKQFIIAHELGHASDYVKNYETNPDYQGLDVAEEWDLHYESNLLTMPVPGLDPVDLRGKLSKFSNLEDFLKTNPHLIKTMDANEIKTIQGLMDAQEKAYRASAYESYADKFAVVFLRNNAMELNNPELANLDQDQKVA